MGIFALFSDSRGAGVETNQTKGNSKVVAVSNTIINATDTDSDGVPDWEEIIWKTDLTKDGTFGLSDKDYIAKQSALEKANVSANGNVSFGTVTNTEDLSKQLFARYMTLQASGQLNEATIQSMTADIAQNIKTDLTETPYTIADVQTFSDTDLAQMNTYAEKFSAAKSKFELQAKTQLATKPFIPGDASFQPNLLSAAQLYTDFAKVVIGLKVPNGAAQSTLMYANALKASAHGLRTLSNMNNEPLQSLVGLQWQSQADAAQAASLSNITSFLKQNGILNVNLNSF